MKTQDLLERCTQPLEKQNTQELAKGAQVPAAADTEQATQGQKRLSIRDRIAALRAIRGETK